VGAITGTLARPLTVIAGLYRGSELVVVGRTVPLSAAQSVELVAVLTPATADRPWPGQISSRGFGGRSTVPTTRVDPVVVAEVSATALASTGCGVTGCASCATVPTSPREISPSCATGAQARDLDPQDPRPTQTTARS
jgi:hypothetical protein